MGDWNADYGEAGAPGIAGKHGLGIQNEPREKMLEFCVEMSRVFANTWFKQPKFTLYTWTSPDGQQRNQIHCILINMR